jgi:hypothetical protein
MNIFSKSIHSNGLAIFGLKRDNKMVWDNLLNDMNDLYQAIGKRWDEIEPLVTKLSSN